VQRAFLRETAGKVPVQVGANWFNTRDTIKRVRFARDHGADAVQICFPGWMLMRQEDYDQFLIDVYEAVPDIALIHYNVGRTKKVSRQGLRPRPAEVPTLLGSKSGGSWSDYMELWLYSRRWSTSPARTSSPWRIQLGAKGSTPRGS